MPLYDYICRACGREFEILVTGNRKAACPACGSEDLAKQMSTFVHRTAGGSGGQGSRPGCGGCTSSDCSGCR